MKYLFLLWCQFEQITNSLLKGYNAKVCAVNVTKKFFVEFLLGRVIGFLFWHNRRGYAYVV